MAASVGKPTDPLGLTIESWAQGFRQVVSIECEFKSWHGIRANPLTVVGSLIVMACVTIANMRRHVLLHKLILVELVFGMFHGTFIFTNPPVYHWYLSVTAIFLNASWSLHNVIAWIKNKPFLSRKASLFYITTVILVQPYWVLEIVANWLYFGGWSNLFVYTRPYEALFRDPWWIFTCVNLFWNIKRRYDFGYIEIIRVSPRFGVLLGAMILSIGFIITDILAVTHVIHGSGLPDGINPFWKLAFVFKCLTDTIVLDDFKTALDRLKDYKLDKIGGAISVTGAEEFITTDQSHRKKSDLYSNGTLIPESNHIEPKDFGNDQSDNEIDLESALRMDSAQLAEYMKTGNG